MTTAAIREKLYNYICIAEDKKVKAIYALVEEEIDGSYDYWNDENFIADLERRSADLKSGKAKGISWENAKAQILNSTQKKAK